MSSEPDAAMNDSDLNKNESKDETADDSMEVEKLSNDDTAGPTADPTTSNQDSIPASSPANNDEILSSQTSKTSSESASEDDDDDGEELDMDKSTKGIKGILNSTEDADTLLLKAATYKEQGNTHFKSGELDKAGRMYRRGCSALKNLNKNNTGDDQVKSLLLSLQTNLSMVCYKQNKHKQSRDMASKALYVDDKNVKALYRRAVAHRKLGDAYAARDDLKLALKFDAENREVRRELLAIKKELEVLKAKEKSALQSAFSSRGESFLYEDKEKEKERIKLEKEAKKKAEEEALKKRKVLWEDECVKRLANDQPAISFEEWEKERKEKEKEEENARKKAKKLEEERRRREREEARRRKTSENSSSDSEHEDANILRGYKTTKDGRKTSYFTRELPDAEKAMIGDIAPKKLDPSLLQPQPTKETSATTNSGIQSSSTSSINKTAGHVSRATSESAWNAAQTWEERNTTEWCTNALQNRLLSTSIQNHPDFDISVTKVESLSGDASFALTSGRKRYIFDYTSRINFEVKKKVEEGEPEDEALASGEAHLPDICSTVENHEYDVEFSWKKRPRGDDENVVKELCHVDFIRGLRESVKAFVQEFNAHY